MTQRQSEAKHDAAKARPSLFPWDALPAVLDVLEYGARKYTPGGWRSVDAARYREALLRHVIAWGAGEECDPESKLSHVAHIVTNGLFLLAFEAKR